MEAITAIARVGHRPPPPQRPLAGPIPILTGCQLTQLFRRLALAIVRRQGPFDKNANIDYTANGISRRRYGSLASWTALKIGAVRINCPTVRIVITAAVFDDGVPTVDIR